SHLDQMLDCGISTLIIVYRDTTGFYIRTHPVKKHNGHVSVLIQLKMIGIMGLTGYGYNQAIYPVGKQGLRYQYLPFVRLPRLANDNLIAFLVGQLLYS